MYQRILSARILLAIGVAFMIISLVLGWISFGVPDWLQFYERSSLTSRINSNTTSQEQDVDLVKFGLWYKCVFSYESNDFACSSWNRHVPSMNEN
jgi:hypothetical protein